ncbi:competence/damage-inducible protein A [Paenibacillus sp. NAIST15-1]|uniref:competence/damage-inducible protein A n=1 Tax=Paenibacillus sp. NAIST15-1 TaxID=1605994 RepID=UPI00086CF40C|nr:competence/damage-inducible protein A [Paenibacillus sp. NAIST15-1]GAV11947.1 putative competence-damage inducible protein CinA [Paenibacillus sp. NAIST15-1]
MKAEIIAVGTELLLGQIVNTNAQYISQRLAVVGVDVFYHTVVGDNAVRIRQCIETACKRSDLLIFTGGLGPTMDDLTKDVLAEMLGRKMTYDEPAMAKMTEMFAGRGIQMVESNKRQANVIDGADVLKNSTGLAVGNALRHDGTTYVLLPGPPREMKPMLDDEAIPWLKRQQLIDQSSLYTRMLKFAGIGESGLENALLDLIEQQTDTTIATYAKEGEVLVRLAVKGTDQHEADVKLDQVEREIHNRLGMHLYAAKDVSLPEVLVEQLSQLGLTLAAAESCTGGMFADMITAVPGSSQVFAGGAVTYSNEMKERILGVPHELLEGENAPGAVSEPTAKAMAEGMHDIADTDFTVAITGVAGPAHSERKPVGLVYIAIAEKGREIVVEELRLNGDREGIRRRTVYAIMYRLWRRLQDRTVHIF